MYQPKVLIVEDEQLVAEDLRQIMTKNGYEVTGTASSGRKAIDLAQENPPDIILMDVRIEGDLNGIETAIIIQGKNERTIPVIFITAFPENQFPVLVAVDACLYVNKPISETELLTCVRRALQTN